MANYSWKVTILVEGHQFLTEPWSWEEVLSTSFEAINCYPKLFASGASTLEVGVVFARYEGTMVIPGIWFLHVVLFPRCFPEIVSYNVKSPSSPITFLTTAIFLESHKIGINSTQIFLIRACCHFVLISSFAGANGFGSDSEPWYLKSWEPKVPPQSYPPQEIRPY